MHASISTGTESRWTTARLAGFTLVGALLTCASFAKADVLAFDRGLPTQNLNIDAGADRSNIEWADIETLPETPWFAG